MLVITPRRVCFDELMFLPQTHLYFRSPAEAEQQRERASAYCRLAPPSLSDRPRTRATNVLFWERHDRKVLNVEALCRLVVETMRLDVKIADFGLAMCDRIVILRWADVIVTLEASHSAMLYQARV